MSDDEHEVRATVAQVVAQVAGCDPAMVEPHMSFGADLGIDSLKAIEILEQVSQRLHVRLDEEDLIGVETVGALTELVQERR